MRNYAARPVALALAFALATTSNAQQTTPLSKRAAAAQHKAQQLLPQAPISVVRFDADEEFGKFVSSDQESFTFYDIDQRTKVTLKYEEVKKLKDGYGGYNPIAHKHVDRRKNLLVATAVVVALAVLIGVAAASR